jgi:hypothetical protein
MPVYSARSTPTNAFGGASRRSATCYDDGAIRRVRVVASMEKPMLYSIVTPILILLLALGASYFITRPIGDRRRHVAAAS